MSLPSRFAPRSAEGPLAADATQVSWRRAVTTAVVPGVLASTPLFLAGTLAVRIRDELGFGVGALGVVFALFAGAGALLGPVNGRIAERLGAGTSLRIGTVGVGGFTVAIAVLADRWWTLAGLMAVTGALASLVQTSTNLWIARTVDVRRQGLALGLKQSAPPMAALLSGLAVPVLAVTVGWRWAFVAAGAAAAPVALAIPSRVVPGRRRSGTERDLDLSMATLVVLACCILLGNSAASAFTGFLVISAVEHGGLGEVAAGISFAVGSMVGIGCRVLFGHVADRSHRSAFLMAAGLLALGAAGTVVLGTGHRLVFVFLTPVVFATAWGWVGLFVLGVIRSNERSPATASGIIQVGGGSGYMLGPIGFGLVVGHSYAAAWGAVGLASLAAAGLVVVARRRVMRELGAMGWDGSKPSP